MNAGSTTQPVGGKKPNAWGLYDMHGNLWEWCADWYDSRYYTALPSDDPAGPSGGTYRVCRGGCWYYSDWHCRSAYRFTFEPGVRDDALGLRVCLIPAE